MAQILDEFEEKIQPHIPRQAAEDFKGIVRQKLHALALDACDLIALKPGEQVNGAAIELRDRLGETRPLRRTSA